MAGPLDDLSGTVDGEPWALQSTQEEVRLLLHQYVNTNARRDTAYLKAMTKNIAMMTKDTKFLKDLKEIEKGIVKSSDTQTKSQKDIQDSITKSQRANSGHFLKLNETMTKREAKNILGGRGGNIFTRTGRGIDKAGGKLIDKFTKFDGKLASILAALPLGATIGASFAVLTNAIDRFREFNLIGQTFQGNLFGMSIMAGKAGLSTEQFGKIIKKNSELAAKVGVQTIADTQKAVRATSKSSAHYGLSLENLAEFSASYLDQLVITGQYDRLTTGERNRRTDEYIKSLTHLSRVTGRSAEQLDKEQRELAQHLDAYAVGLTLSGGKLERYNDNLDVLRKSVAKYPKAFQESFIQLAVDNQYWGNYMQTELGRMIGRIPHLNTALADTMNAFKNNDPAEFSAALDRFQNIFHNLSQDQREQLIANLKNAKDAGARQIAQVLQNSERLNIAELAYVKNRKAHHESMGKNAIEAQRLAEGDSVIRATAAGNAKDFLVLQSDLSLAFGEIRAAIFEKLAPKGGGGPLSKFGELLGKITDKLVKFVRSDKFDKMIDMLFTTISDATTEFFKWFDGINWEKAKVDLVEMWEGFKTVFGGMISMLGKVPWEGIGNGIQWMADNITLVVAALVSWKTGLLSFAALRGWGMGKAVVKAAGATKPAVALADKAAKTSKVLGGAVSVAGKGLGLGSKLVGAVATPIAAISGLADTISATTGIISDLASDTEKVKYEDMGTLIGQAAVGGIAAILSAPTGPGAIPITLGAYSIGGWAGGAIGSALDPETEEQKKQRIADRKIDRSMKEKIPPWLPKNALEQAQILEKRDAALLSRGFNPVGQSESAKRFADKYFKEQAEAATKSARAAEEANVTNKAILNKLDENLELNKKLLDANVAAAGSSERGARSADDAARALGKNQRRVN